MAFVRDVDPPSGGARDTQSNFNNYCMMRINEAPSIDVHLVDSKEVPGGIGETSGQNLAAVDEEAV